MFGVDILFTLHLDIKDLHNGQVLSAHKEKLDKMKLNELCKCVNKLLSPHSSNSTQSITPVKRPSRFERVGSRRSFDANDNSNPKIKRTSM
jgi:hypothetical protein